MNEFDPEFKGFTPPTENEEKPTPKAPEAPSEPSSSAYVYRPPAASSYPVTVTTPVPSNTNNPSNINAPTTPSSYPTNQTPSSNWYTPKSVSEPSPVAPTSPSPTPQPTYSVPPQTPPVQPLPSAPMTQAPPSFSQNPATIPYPYPYQSQSPVYPQQSAPMSWTPSSSPSPSTSNPTANSAPYQWTANSSPSKTGGGNQEPPKPKKKWKLIIAVVIILVIIGVVVAASGVLSNNSPSVVSSAESTSSSSSGLAISPDSGDILPAQEVFKKASPSVVGIQTYSNMNHLTDSMLGEGSGIIFTSDGYIITNAHVVTDDNQKAILVLLADGTSYQAKLVGKDTSTDLAVLKIDATNLPVAEFGDSSKLEIGETCYAIGNPGGSDFANSMARGIISGLDRQLMEANGFIVPSIQTDTAINPGNSGGALVNSAGQVIGITSSKIALEYFEGMGFAIPINDAQPIVNELIQSGSINNRPRIGITYSESEIIDEATAKLYGIPTGVLISAVDSTSDAAQQGLKAGDIIHSIDGQTISSIKDIQSILRKYRAGDEITVEVYRPTSSASLANGETLTITFKLMEQTEN